MIFYCYTDISIHRLSYGFNKNIFAVSKMYNLILFALINSTKLTTYKFYDYE